MTGGGKTAFAFMCMQEARTLLPLHRVVITVPTVALLDQWVLGLTDDLGVTPNDIATYSGDAVPSSPHSVNVMVLNSARRWAPAVAREQATFLIADECHRSASQENAKALVGPHVATLGLSATPDRDYDDLFEEVIVPALGPVIYTYDYSEARRDGVISPFELLNVAVPLDESEQVHYDNLTRKLAPFFRRRQKGEQVDNQILRLLRDRSRISTSAQARLPTAVRLIEQHRRERALVFHEQISAANVLTTLLRQRSHRVAAYHSGLGASLRQDNLRLFRRGEIDVLVTCRALDEGIDVPNASVAVIAASTASTRQRIQRLGRVLRPARGKDLASIYTLYATQPEAERLRIEEEHLEGAEHVRWLELPQGGA